MSFHSLIYIYIYMTVSLFQISPCDLSAVISSAVIPIKEGDCCSPSCSSHLLQNVVISTNNSLKIVNLVCNAFSQRPHYLQVQGNVYQTFFVASILRHFDASFETEVYANILNTPHQKSPTYTKDFFIVRPTHAILVIDAIIDLITHWKWGNSTWILDKHSGFNVHEILRRGKVRKITVHCKTVTFDEITDNFIWNLKSANNSGYVVAVHNDTLISLMKKTLDVQVFNRTAWIIVNPYWPFGTFPTYNETIGRTQFTLLATQITPKMNKVCVNLTNFSNWDKVKDLCSGNKTPKIVAKNIPKDDRMGSSSVTFIFYDVFYSSKTLNIEQVTFAQWNTQDGLHFVRRLQDEKQLKSRHIFATGCWYPPILNVNDDGSVSGYLGALFQAVADNLGLEKTLDRTMLSGLSAVLHSAFWLSRQTISIFDGNFKNGWTGVIENLAAKEFDLILLNYGMTPQRSTIAHFTPSVCTTFARFLIQASNTDVYKDDINFDLYLKPFHSLVWISLAIVLAITIGIWTLGHRILHNSNENWLWWLISGNALVDAFDSDIRALSSRIIFFTIMLTVYLSFCCYSSVLTSFLAIDDEVLPFRNVEELVEKNEYSVIILRGTTYFEYFKSAKPGTPHAKIWQRIISAKNAQDFLVPNLRIAADLLHSKEKYTAVVEGNNRVLTLWEDRSFKFIPGDAGFSEYNYMPIRPDFPFVHAVSNVITRMKETGLMNRIHSLHMTEWTTVKERELVLHLKDVASLCVLLLIGIILSFLSLCIELLYNRIKTDTVRY